MSMSKADTPNPRLKLVIRRLPPTLPESVFWNSVAPWITDSTCTWKRFIKGRPSEGPYDHALHSRAYCLMNDVISLVAFHRAFDGHVFRSKTGAEYQAVVEFAPVQKTPVRTKIKVDARQGSIENDPDFESFLASLQTPQPKITIEPSLPIAQPTTTPLLEYLRTQGVKTGGKKKAKPESSSTDVARNAAVAAVSASAARRTPKDQGGTMVAGKGRDLAGASDSSKGKSRNKKSKAQVAPTVPPPSITAKNFPALAPGSSAPKPAAPRQNDITKPQLSPQPKPPPPTASGGKSTPTQGTGPSTRGRGSRGRGGSKVEAEWGSRATTDIIPDRGSANTTGARAPGRGGSTRGRGKPAATVTGILTRIPESSRGGRRGGGTADPKLARIDAD